MINICVSCYLMDQTVVKQITEFCPVCGTSEFNTQHNIDVMFPVESLYNFPVITSNIVLGDE